MHGQNHIKYAIVMFNSFLNIYLRIFYSSFPLKIVFNRNNNDNNWIALGIKTSCRRNRELYLLCRNSNNLELKRCYQVYCKILSNVIMEAKRIYYDQKKSKNQAINVKPLGISLRSYLIINTLKLVHKS